MIQENGQSPSSRSVAPQATCYRFGVFELDAEAGELRKDGRLVRIRNQPFKILTLLLERPGIVITREALHRELWPAEELVDFDQGLNHSIREIRAAIGDNAESPRFVQTLPRRGYRFLAEVRPLAEGSPLESRDRAPADCTVPPVTAGERRRPWPAMAIGLGVVLLLLAWRLPGRLTPSAEGPRPVVRLLVLPFAPASTTAGDELVADGLTDEIIARVGRARPGGVIVLGRTSSMEYKKRSPRLPDLRNDLGVSFVVEGRVQKAPAGFRAIASLIRVSDGARIWTLDDQAHADLGSFQQSVSDRVARGIDSAVELPRAAERRSPKSVEANLNYLRGRALMVTRDRLSLGDALVAFEACLRDEPTFAPAWASLAETRVAMMDQGLTPATEAWPLAKAAADRSIALDPDLAEGWNILAAYYSLAVGNEGDARRAMERTLVLNPNLVIAHHWNAVGLSRSGRHAQAEAAIRRALTLDPLSPVLHGNLGESLSAQGKKKEALREFETVLDLRPDWPMAHIWIGRALGREKRWAEATASFERAARGGDGAARAYLVAALVQSGDRERASAVNAGLRSGRGAYVAPYYRAVAAFSLGDRDTAIGDLRQTVADRSSLMRQIGYTEEWKGFEDDVRFRRLVELIHRPRGLHVAGSPRAARAPSVN